MQHPINILERYWNFTEFRPLQEDIIDAVIAGEDTFVLLPTGGGKSLCFQIPALVKDGICIVISPLVALMKNQVENLKDKGIKAMAITSGIKPEQLDCLLDNCIYGNYKFLYLSPERLQQELIQERIKQMNVNLIAVDEAHCISQWGNDFRPAYKNITLLRQIQPSVNVVALTASATPKVVEDIVNELDFIQPKIFKQSFARPNLAYMVLHEDDKYYRIESILKKYTAPSIIYVRNRKLTLDISTFLESKGIGATYYHGGLSNKEKESNMSQWLNNQKQVMIATNAFGMGIDKPDVKTVIHFNLPESMESYFQEAGRAGRNGEKAFAVILKNNSDEQLVKNQFLSVLPTVDYIKQVYRKLCNYFQISYGEGEYTTHDFDFNTFCKTYNFSNIICYNALLLLDRTSIINLSRQFHNKVSMQVVASNPVVFHYLETHQDKALIVKTMLRMYGGIFEHDTTINTLKIADKAATSETVVISVLKQLEKDEIISLNLSKTDAQITFIQPREDDKTINRIANIIEQQNNLKLAQVNAVLDYIKNDTVCKSRQLLSYFGEKETIDCGICSVCSKAKKNIKPQDLKALRNRVIELLEHSDMSSRSIVAALKCPETELNNVIQLLLEHQIISVTKTNTYKLFHK
ncbi:RecQ family ATP-dependent DNA helicase [Yeosuana aromativorans]|uniref:RecQ family ATP-dependent DNA helicase n=1 Tax=Yeosuana aromativorans TaxID=288019 RepID=UPI00166BAF19|nr:RecQ family ATP-dependent DNA helicase [Yeosuana aromativorans]